MSQCIKCGSNDGVDYSFAHVETNTREEAASGKRKKRTVETEKLLGVRHTAVCPACAKKAKWKSVLMTIPITLIAAPIMVFLGFFAARPNRDARREIASLPVTLPLVAVILWLCGLSVYVPLPLAFYATEIARKGLGGAHNTFMVPLEARHYRRRGNKPVTAISLKSKTPLKSELAKLLLPVVRGEAGEETLDPLIGREFSREPV